VTEDELLWELEAAFDAAKEAAHKELEAALRKAAMERHPSGKKKEKP